MILRPADAFWRTVQRRVAGLQPDVAADILKAFRILRESLSDVELARLISEGQLDKLLDDALLDRAFLPLRERLVAVTERSFDLTTHADVPKGGKINGTQAVAFDTLNPRVIDAVRQLDSRVINTLKDETRETVRAFVENGLREGTAPRALARDLRQVIGLAPNQAQYVENLRRELLDGSVADASRRKLLDQRYNLSRLANLPETERLKRIDTITESYRKSWVAQNAETNARTATLDSVKLGQQLSWEDAVRKGVVAPGTLYKRWTATLDDRTRPEHRAMNGEEVQYDGTFSNGDTVPGESDFNCRCVAVFFVKRESQPRAA